MSAHTPGPWEYEKALHEQRWQISQIDGSALTVADVYSLANARLIAAAPRMLALIRELADPRYGREHLESSRRDARAILREIEGA